MIVNKNIEKKASIGGKFKYSMDCINPECKNKVFKIRCLYEARAAQDGLKYFACCEECSTCSFAMNIQKQNMIERYGVENSYQLEKTKDTIKSKMISLYGVDNAFKAEEVKEKIRRKLSERTEEQKLASKIKANQTLDVKEEDGTTRRQKISKKSFEERVKRIGKENMMGWMKKDIYEDIMTKKFGAKHFWASDYGKVTLENLVRRYGLELGTFKYEDWKRKISKTLENMIEKFGEEEGIKKYEAWYFSSIGKPSSGQVSKISKKFFKELETFCNKDFSKSYEKCFYDKENKKRYFVDLCIDKKIIEFNGDYWHANPEIYKENDLVKLKGRELLEAKNIWLIDTKKVEFFNKIDYSIKIVWEKDYRENNINLEEIRSFLYDN